jgi:hypothetical protein
VTNSNNALTRLKAVIVVVILVIVLIVAAGGLYYQFYYTPPPSTATTYSYCNDSEKTSGNSSMSSLTFYVFSTKMEMDFTPAVAISLGNLCVYNDTALTIPLRCGTMCGGGVGEISQMVEELKLNMTLTLTGNQLSPSNYSLKVSTQNGANFSALFYPYMQVYVNSRQVSSNSSPLCSGTTCTSFSVQFPIAASGSYLLVVNSSEELVP